MTYQSDDQTSSKTPFAGDQSGDIFSEPSNLVAQSPLTTVRTVETQSGFLVVLKDVDDRTSLSVKRKIGTPPQSHVLLTPDEVRKLSRILGGQNQEETSEFKVSGFKPHYENGSSDGAGAGNGVGSSFGAGVGSGTEIGAGTGYGVGTGSGVGDEAGVAGPDSAIDTLTSQTQKSSDFSDLDHHFKKLSKRGDRQNSPRRSGEKKVLVFGAAGIGGLVLLALVAGLFVFFNYSSSTQPPEVKEIAKRGMNSENVDTFVRTYVSNLLDFSPRSYKYSQIQAMSKMEPELMKKYWKETNFPLSTSQLKRLPENQSVIVNKVVQEPTSSLSTDVDIYAEMVSSKAKTPTPVHLRLSLSLDQQGDLAVVSQKDMGAEDAKAKK